VRSRAGGEGEREQCISDVCEAKHGHEYKTPARTRCVLALYACQVSEHAATDCLFCAIPEDRIVLSSALACVIEDGFPISPGHSLVIPRRHVRSIFELSEEERAALLMLLEQAKLRLDRQHRPDGYNIGINDGAAAGQTVMHLHVHLIPRYKGDSADPRGGVRWIMPDKARYWDESDG
jgi:diadenosine tetraphosphate (Ap4A) HIT family hydrolase